MSKEGMKGFAAGIFLATGILGGYYFLEETDKQAITIEKLKKASEEYGYNLVKADDSNKEITENNKNITEAPKEESVNTSASQQSPSTNNSSESASKAILYTLSITSGMGSDDIALILFENKMIEDADSFEKYLLDNKLAKKIRIGEFQITNEMSFEQIANIITKKTQ